MASLFPFRQLLWGVNNWDAILAFAFGFNFKQSERIPTNDILPQALEISRFPFLAVLLQSPFGPIELFSTF